MVVRLDRTRSLDLGEVREFLFCFAFLARMPGLHRKKCTACQDDNHFNSKECKRCGGALDIQSPGRRRAMVVSCGQPLSFWERVWSNATEPSVLLTQHLTPLDHAFAHCGHPQLSWGPEQEALLHLTKMERGWPRETRAMECRLFV